MDKRVSIHYINFIKSKEMKECEVLGMCVFIDIYITYIKSL